VIVMMTANYSKFANKQKADDIENPTNLSVIASQNVTGI